MGLGDFFKNLFGSSAKSSVSGMADKAESFASDAIEKAKDYDCVGTVSE